MKHPVPFSSLLLTAALGVAALFAFASDRDTPVCDVTTPVTSTPVIWEDE